MPLYDVALVMINVRLPNQYTSLASAPSCQGASVELILHAHELLAQVDGTGIYSGGFASIQSREDTKLTTHGFERQGAFLQALRSKQQDLLVCSDAVLSFDAKVEGGCGYETITLQFDSAGSLLTIGPVTSNDCGT
jgi:hypothetical protein